MTAIRVHRIPHSTNVERVALACGIKGIEVEWVDHDPADRATIVAISGQRLVPVAEIGGEVIHDSPLILEAIERLEPTPPLYPPIPQVRSAIAIFTEWFNEVWKGPPNALVENPEPGDAAALSARMRGWTDRLDVLLRDREWMIGDQLSAADVVAWPFLRYAVDEPEPGDDDGFHIVLHRELSAGEHPDLERWIERMREFPHA